MNIELLPPFPTHMRTMPWPKPMRSAAAQAVPATQLIKYLDYALYRVSQQAARQATPNGTPADENQARNNFINRLAQRLTQAMPFATENISDNDLLDTKRFYTLEGACFFIYHCSELLGETDFLRHAAMWLTQQAPVSALPLTTSQRFVLLTQLLKNQAHSELTIELQRVHQVVARWRCPLLHTLPADLQPWGRHFGLSYIEGLLMAIPTLSGLPAATLTERHALSHYGDYQEWLVSWAEADYPSAWPVWLGVATSLVVMALALGWPVPYGQTLAWLSSWPLTLGVVWYAWRRVNYENLLRARTTRDQFNFARQYHQTNQTSANDLLAANHALTQRVAELSALHAIGVTLSEQQPLDVLLDTCLNAVVAHLNFDRAFIMLREAHTKHLRAIRFTPGYSQQVQQLKDNPIPLEPSTYLERLMQGQVVWIHAPQTVFSEAWRHLTSHETLLTDLVIAPLIARGQLVGLLLVDNGLSQNPIPANTSRVLLGVANQMANAIENYQLYQTLEQRVRERTAELENAIRQAERATASKSEFLAFMSHEIRNPLSGITGAAELLSTTVTTDFQKEMVDKLLNSADTLRTLINNVLDLSKIEARRMELERHPTLLSACIEGVLDLVAANAAKKNLELAYVIDPSVPPAILADSNRLRQVLLNLLGNAIKFTDHGEVSVRVTAKPLEDGQWRISLAVRDTGVGIPPNQFSRLFQSYSQLDTLPDRKNSGTGLGLVISQQLAQLMGGELSAESTGVPGQGSTFHLTLVAPAAPVPPEANLSPFPDMAVLVIEDNLTQQQCLQHGLHGWQAQVLIAKSLVEALTEAQALAFRPTLAVINWRLAEPSQEDTLRQLRHQYDKLPVVFINASFSPSRSPLPGSLTLSHPLRIGQLHQAIEKLLNPPPQLGPQPVSATPVPATVPILLVEDNPVNQTLAKRMLQVLGYVVDACNNGREALEALAQKNYGVVFMDLHMPEMDGLEATERIRRLLPATRQPRIVAMTANVLPADRERCQQAGMDDFLAKPISLQDLRQCLAQWLPPLSATTQPPAPPPNPEANHSLDTLVKDVGLDAAYNIIGLYLNHAPHLLEEVKKAFEAGNRTQLRGLAHQWRGSSGNLGLRQVQVQCIRLESQALGAPLTVLAETIQALDRAHTKTLGVVQAFRESLALE